MILKISKENEKEFLKALRDRYRSIFECDLVAPVLRNLNNNVSSARQAHSFFASGKFLKCRKRTALNKDLYDLGDTLFENIYRVNFEPTEFIFDGRSYSMDATKFLMFVRKHEKRNSVSTKCLDGASAKRARNVGHTWERDCVKYMVDCGFDDCVTSRSTSRSRDDAKVDLCNKHEGVDFADPNSPDTPRLPYNIQCKCTKGLSNYPVLLDEIEEFNGHNRVNVIFHKCTEKQPDGVFKTRGEYALLHLEDFLKMIRGLNGEDV